MDSQLNEYKYIYRNTAVVFSKKEMKKKTDSCDNFGNWATPLYARNFCFDLARSKNLDYFIMADDDITDLKHVYVDNDGKFKRKSIKDLDSAVEKIIEFSKCNNNLDCISFALNAGYFGGKNGQYKNGIKREVQCFMLWKTTSGARFLSTKNEDLNITIKHFDRLMFTVFDLCSCSPKRATNAGGINYDSDYENSAYSLIIAPSAIKILESGKMSKSSNNLYPKILSGSYKK